MEYEKPLSVTSLSLKPDTRLTTMPDTTKTHPYDGFFPVGRSKKAKAKAPLEETDYEEIFRAAGNSIPHLDLPELEQPTDKRSAGSSQLDYSNIFSSSVEVATPLEELLLGKPNIGAHVRPTSRVSNNLRGSDFCEPKQALSIGSLDQSFSQAQQLHAPVGNRKSNLSEQILKQKSSYQTLDQSFDAARQFNVHNGGQKPCVSEQMQESVSGSLNQLLDGPKELNVQYVSKTSTIYSDPKKESSSESLNESFDGVKQLHVSYDNGKSILSEQKPEPSSGSLKKVFDCAYQLNVPHVGISKPKPQEEDIGLDPEVKVNCTYNATSLEDKDAIPPKPELSNPATKLDLNDVHHSDKVSAVSWRQNSSVEFTLDPRLKTSASQSSPSSSTSNDMFEILTVGANVMGSSSSASTKSNPWISDGMISEPAGPKVEKSQRDRSEPLSGNHSPNLSDEEIDENSVAVTAAVRKALNEAQATLKFAKELMVRKKEERSQSIKENTDNRKKYTSNVESLNSSIKSESLQLKEEDVSKLFSGLSFNEDTTTCHTVPNMCSKIDNFQEGKVRGKRSSSALDDLGPGVTSIKGVDKEDWLFVLAEKNAASAIQGEKTDTMAREIPTAHENVIKGNVTHEAINCSEEKQRNYADVEQRQFASEIKYVPPTFQWNFDAKTFRSCEGGEEEEDYKWGERNDVDSEESIEFHDVMHEFEQKQEHLENILTEIKVETNVDIPESFPAGSMTSDALEGRSENHVENVKVEIDECFTVDDSVSGQGMRNEKLECQTVNFEGVEHPRNLNGPNREKIDNLNEHPIYHWVEDKVMRVETNCEVKIEDFGSNDVYKKIETTSRDGLDGCCETQMLEPPADAKFESETKQFDRKDDRLLEMCEQAPQNEANVSDVVCNENEDEKSREVDEGEWYEETLEGITITAELKEPDGEPDRSNECVEFQTEKEVLSYMARSDGEDDESETNSSYELSEENNDGVHLNDVCEERHVEETDFVCESDDSDEDNENLEVGCDEVLAEDSSLKWPSDGTCEEDEGEGGSETGSVGKEQIEDANSRLEDHVNDEFDSSSFNEKESFHSSDERWTNHQTHLEAERPSSSGSSSTEESASEATCQNVVGNDNLFYATDMKTNSKFEEGSVDADKLKEKDLERRQRIVVERAIKEARERAFAEVRERAEKVAAKGSGKPFTLDDSADQAKLKSERAAVERATADARERAIEKMMAEIANAKKKASADKNVRSSMGDQTNSRADKASMEAQIKSGRTAVERATADARVRAFEKMLSEATASTRSKAASGKKYSASTEDKTESHIASDHGQNTNCTSTSSRQPSSIISTEEFVDANNESNYWNRAEIEKKQRTAERAAKALAEKNRRDLLAQKEQAERHRLAETVDAEVKRWSSGKERNLRALLSTLQYILGPDSGWQPIPLTDLVSTTAVKKAFRRATLVVHPDKLQQRGASIQRKYTCEKVFDLLKEAWNKFDAEQR